MTELSPEAVRNWAKHAHGSPLYAHLIGVIADSDQLMEVLNRIENWPRPNVLFAAVQYLLMRGRSPELARFYPSLHGDPAPVDDVDDPFRDFVIGNEEQIVEIGRTRFTQTNECRRCALLLPAIWRTALARFHLIDVGSSAGLNLALDRYRYRWDDIVWGPPESPVQLVTELRGRPPEPGAIEVLSRTGLDLNPIDLTDPEERMWLNALIWPEHEERRQRLRAAVSAASSVDFRTVRGSALDTLGPTLDDLPDGEPALVMNSFTLNQFTGEERDQFAETLKSASGKRPVAQVSLEHMHRDDLWAKLAIDEGGGLVVIGQAHPHGEWLDLYARP